MFKNINFADILELKNLVTIQNGNIISTTLVQNNNVSLTVFGFGQGEEISTHQSSGEALITVLEGKAKITIEDKEYILNQGESILMPALSKHAVYALEDMKMFLTVVFKEGHNG